MSFRQVSNAKGRPQSGGGGGKAMNITTLLERGEHDQHGAGVTKPYSLKKLSIDVITKNTYKGAKTELNLKEN